MTPLPNGWRWAMLGEIADVVGGVTKDSKLQSRPDLVEVPYLRVANVQRGRIDLSNVATIRVPPQKAAQLELQPGDVLLNEGGDRDKLGRGWVWQGQIPGCIHQNHVFRARIRDGLIHPKLLAWYVNEVAHKWFELNGKQSVNLASISLSKIRSFPVPVPPVEEQWLMIEILEDHLSHLTAAEASLAAVRLRIGKLWAAGLQRLWEEAAASSPPRTVESIGQVTTGSTPSTRQAGVFGGAMPFLTPSDIGHGERIFSCGRTLSDKGEGQARIVGPNAVVAVCIGATLGKVGWIDGRAATNQQINALSLDPAVASAQFVAAVMASPPFQRQMIGEASSTTLPILNKSRFARLTLPLPDLIIQDRLLSRLMEVSTAQERTSASLVELQRKSMALRRALLDAAFAGRLTGRASDMDRVEEMAGV
ncbi:restriction endonuclease subunit S [Micromonospora echinaurantiaca]|uniref:restriction endonuclease subunit S n=1 Tax=Micromonospora echinaurantiaca TaxID=47857 RepID=UPI003795466D